MQIRVRGWGRNCGYTDIASHDLRELRISDDQNQYLRRDTPSIFEMFGKVEVHWHQEELRLGGNYRMEIAFNHSDVLRLFKSAFGTELKASLIERHGFTLSPELVQAVLKTVKLTDLTIGDLVKMTDQSSEEKPPEKKTLKLVPRRA